MRPECWTRRSRRIRVAARLTLADQPDSPVYTRCPARAPASTRDECSARSALRAGNLARLRRHLAMRRSSVIGKSRLHSTGGAAGAAPGVWPSGKKRSSRRDSAS